MKVSESGYTREELLEIVDTYLAEQSRRWEFIEEKGDGMYVYAENGDRYLDFFAGIAVSSAGNANKKVAKAIADQAANVIHASNYAYTLPMILLAKKVCDTIGMEKIVFQNSGTEANEAMIKMARKYGVDNYGPDRYKIVTAKNSFHGRTITTLAATGQDHYHELFGPLTPGFEYVTAGDEAELEKALENKNVAAVMIECIQGEGGVVVLDEQYIKAVRKLTEQKDVLLIVDEVQTGNGRTGEYFAYMNFGIFPDIVTTAKGLGGGLPIGATLFAEKLKSVFSFGDHGSTYGGNPVCCAGAVNIVSRIDEQLLCSVKEKSKIIFDTLSGAKGIESVCGMGLMIGIKTVKPAADVVRECMERGVLCLTAKDKVRLLPALNIPVPTLKEALEIIKNACFC